MFTPWLCPRVDAQWTVWAVDCCTAECIPAVSVNTSSSCWLREQLLYSCLWYLEPGRWLLVPCRPAAQDWSADVRTAGHYSVFRCAASYQCPGLTEAAVRVNTLTSQNVMRTFTKTTPKEITKQTCRHNKSSTACGGCVWWATAAE